MKTWYRLAFVAFLALGLAACEGDFEKIQVPPRDIPQTQEEINLARRTLNNLQARSFAENREYCGYIGRHRTTGRLVASKPTPGTTASCAAPLPDASMRILASYHTHGAYLKEYENELPSVTDVRATVLLQVDGYVSTPGGRFWHIDPVTKTARQICSLGCLLSDPRFTESRYDALRQTYSVEQIKERTGRL